MHDTEPTNSSGDTIVLGDNIRLPMHSVTFTFSRSSGPGGQNVNKVASRVQMRVDLEALAAVIGEPAVNRLTRVNPSRVTKDGVFQVVASDSRSQHTNRATCIERFAALVERALQPPRIRRRTKPNKASKQRRLDNKRKRGQVKMNRKRPSMDD